MQVISRRYHRLHIAFIKFHYGMIDRPMLSALIQHGIQKRACPPLMTHLCDDAVVLRQPGKCPGLMQTHSHRLFHKDMESSANTVSHNIVHILGRHHHIDAIRFLFLQHLPVTIIAIRDTILICCLFHFLFVQITDSHHIHILKRCQ